MTPIRFTPLLKRRRWGGTRLGTVLHKPIGQDSDYAESWELSDHGENQSTVDGGPWDGLTLHELVRHHNKDLFGIHSGLEQFPLLLKFLDACDYLSVQVHPDDVQARQDAIAANGKTEFWVIVNCEPGSRVFAGLKEETTRDEVLQHLTDGTIEECLHAIEVHSGDCIFVPAGTVHAIGPGVLLAEVQQTSDVTLRLYDWGRVDAEGRPRQLHLEEALDCADFESGPVNPVNPQRLSPTESEQPSDVQSEELVRCDHFVIHRHCSSDPFSPPIHECFHALMVLDGGGRIAYGNETQALQTGNSVLIPAACCDFEIVPESSMTILDAFLPVAKNG